MRTTTLVTAAFTLALVGCKSTSSPIVTVAPAAKRPLAKEYWKFHDRYTRHGHLRSVFDAVLNVDATFEPPEFRAAFAERYLNLYNVPESEADQVRAELIADGDATWQFHIETATHLHEDNDLTSRRTMWRMSLLDDHGRAVEPSEITTAKGKPTYMATFYANSGDFTHPWRVRFPKQAPDGAPLIGPDTKTMTLRIGGPQGSIDMVWKLQPSARTE
jgi:hypothetical protein